MDGHAKSRKEKYGRHESSELTRAQGSSDGAVVWLFLLFFSLRVHIMCTAYPTTSRGHTGSIFSCCCEVYREGRERDLGPSRGSFKTFTVTIHRYIFSFSP